MTAFRQSLAHGPLGIVLHHIELAHHGAGSWQAVHSRLAATGPLIDGDEASLFLGAPAMAYVLHQAAADSDRYTGAVHALARIVAEHTRRRLTAAHARIDRGEPTSFAEYDLFRGLTGLGVLLLRRGDSQADVLRGVLEYLVRLTEPLPDTRLGWWVAHSPAKLGSPTPGGHANAGLAHGITGPLALLALAELRGVTVPDQEEAMRRICRWLDRIRVSDRQKVHWPRWTTATTAVHQHSDTPSWCYGTPGLVRAQQLAALALGDPDRKRMAERALLSGLADTHQLDRLTGQGLCHGVGGLLRTVQRVAQDADDPAAFTRFLPQLSERFLAAGVPAEAGFLEGAAGAALAFEGVKTDEAPGGDWDACLLLV
ncbi:lanthionine synthetase [Streptomyces sp. V2]|uniref:lanthionine synthetase C family protein n=1 Tax=Streptomyces TaxID=1883 RepID=UPI0006EB3F1F|nr:MULTISPECIES: lanthionine synthetase C family protein [Streptomyces]PWG09282.1 lanthionine synthetase [Streptomyces sp. V2]